MFLLSLCRTKTRVSLVLVTWYLLPLVLLLFMMVGQTALLSGLTPYSSTAILKMLAVLSS